MSGSTEMKGETKSSDRAAAGRLAKAGNQMLVYSHSEDEAVWGSKENLSALVLTKTGDVFGAGVNCLVVGSHVTDRAMKEGGGRHLQDYVKVDSLSGQDFRKIAVGSGIGVALTRSNGLMSWKSNSVAPKDIVEFESYRAGENCRIHTGTPYTKDTVGKVDLSHCSSCRPLPYSQPTTPNKDVPSKKFVLYGGSTITLPCYKCLTPCSYETLNNIDLQYCSSCDLMLERDKIHEVAQITKFATPFKVMGSDDEKIVDIACCGFFVAVLLENNKLVMESFKTGNQFLEQQNQNPNPIKKVALYGGGGNLFVKSEEGNLWICEISDGKINLEQIKLTSAVNKVCRGSAVTAALLADESVWFITDDDSDDHMTYHLHHNSGTNRFTDISVVAMTDIFLVQGQEASVLRMGKLLGGGQVEVRFCNTDLESALLEMVTPQPLPPAQPIIPLPPNQVKLYGKSQLADLTFKLSDEEFPAHSLVLYTTSAHFQEVFTTTEPPPKVLDVSEYNPKAYKCLLQHFYQVTPDDLDAEDLVDLRQIATSYGETLIVEQVKTKIKTKLDEENVLKIYQRSKQFDFKDLMKDCEEIIRSPAFMDKLVNAAIQNTSV